MQDIIQRYAKEKIWAVAGASQDTRKFGYKIYHTLKNAGYTVYALNPRGGLIDQDPVYENLAALPETPTVVDVVIPPGHQTLQLAQDAQKRGVKALWFQPGAEWPAAIAWAKEQGMDVIEDCILIHHVFHQP